MDATAQANALVQAYNNIAETWELILEKMSVNAQEHATNKWAASIVINRIPFAGDAISTVDFVIEAASDGEIDSPVSQFFSNLLDKLTRKDVPNGETCAEIVKMLTDGTEECIEGLKDARKAYGDLVDSDAQFWNDKWSHGYIYEIIPGYLGG